jgi:hypothetical protein
LAIAAVTVLTLGAAGIVIAGTLGCVIYGAAFGTLLLGAAGAALGAAGGMIRDGIQGNEFGSSIWDGAKAGFGIGAILGFFIGGAVGFGAAASVSGLGNTCVWTNLGGNGANIAAANAAKDGLITIGKTFGGRYLSIMGNIFGRYLTRAAWASLSQVMVSTTTMTTISLYSGATIYAGSIYAAYELPILIDRGIVIIRHIIGG